MSPRLTKSEISFKVGKKNIEFTIVHNLQPVFGLSLNDALHSWTMRTKSYTPESLCKYIMSKDESFVAMTETQYKRLLFIGSLSSNKK